MISGRSTLVTFEQALAEIRQKLEEVDKQTNELTNRQLALEQEDLADYRQLARLRVDLLATEKAQSSLDEAERLTKALLEKRQIELAVIGEEITAAKKRVKRSHSAGKSRLQQSLLCRIKLIMQKK